MEAFVAVATELHFGRAAEKLHMGQPAVSGLVRRLETEMDTELLDRGTRRVSLTEAGVEFHRRAEAILQSITAATVGVRRWADGKVGTVRLGVTPPVAPAIPRHLDVALRDEAPGLTLHVKPMWLNDLCTALTEGQIDVGLTCGPVLPELGLSSRAICRETLLVGFRSGHRLGRNAAVDLGELAEKTLGVHSEGLFPTWVLEQRQVLLDAGMTAPVVELADTDSAAWKWLQQNDVDWIFTTPSMMARNDGIAVRPVSPTRYVPTMLHWLPSRETGSAARRFVELAASVEIQADIHQRPVESKPTASRDR